MRSHPLLRYNPSTQQNQKLQVVFQTINNETWTIPWTCPTIYKSYPGKSIPLETTTIYNKPSKQHVPTKMQRVSLRLTASILPDSLHGESRICCLRHHRENGNSNKTTKQHDKTTQSRLSDKTPTLIHPGYRVTSPKTLKTLMNVTWLQRLVFPRHNRKRFSRTPKHPFLQTPQEHD